MHAGLSSTLSFTVTDADTAAAVGSGDLPVLGTPRLLAWMEAATCAAVAEEMTDGQTTVGTRVEVEHQAATPVGSEVSVTATLSHVDGRLLRFEVGATAADGGRLLGSGRITRVLVDRTRFLDRLS